MNATLVILTSEELLYISSYLKQLLKKLLNKNYKIYKIYYCNQEPGKNNIIIKIRYYINFFGMFNSFIIICKYIKLLFLSMIVCPLFKNEKYAFNIKSISKHFNIPYKEIEDINDERYVMELENMNPDVILSLAYPKIIKEKILKIPKIGSLNVHSALLPKYRGVNSPFWQLYYKERESGITVHEIHSKLDEGDIIYQEKYDISKIKSLNQFYIYITKKGPDIVLNAIDIYINNKKRVILTKKEEKESYFSFPTKKERISFIKSGGRFF